ncbi:hypothetical protein ACQUQP_16170 [Marinobacterium sp. YM272]|uniref:hypothetical protein n=1 Tax=Marinobacterium sp. YM272 TaxID=3421654 RepID=UPI003D7FAE72
MKNNRQNCQVTGPTSPLFRDFHQFLQVCIEDLDQLCQQDEPASASHPVMESGTGSEHES